MFTGIVTNLATIQAVSKVRGQDLLLTLKHEGLETEPAVGSSVSCSGICLTVIKILTKAHETYLTFQASRETINNTTLGNWSTGKKINIEFPLKFGSELGGHLVSGHIDATGIINSINLVEGSHAFEISAPSELMKFICCKGSIGVDGISLTVNSVKDNLFAVNIIKHTWDVTNLQYYKVGDSVNLEIDLIARYLNRLNEFSQK